MLSCTPDPVAEPTEFGRLLKRLRQERHLSQPQLARLAGVSRGYVGGIESGIRGRNPSRDVILTFARALNVPPLELLQAAGKDQPADREPRKVRPTFRQFIMGDPLLRMQEKEMLITLYDSYSKGRR